MSDDMPQGGAEIKQFPKAPGRWIAVYVDGFNHPIVGAQIPAPPPVDPKKASWQPRVAWEWMLKEARWRRQDYDVSGRIVPLARGQLVLSERHLARNANWTRKYAASFLARLSRHGMIEAETTRPDGQLSLDFSESKRGPLKGPPLTIVTICNYNKFQHTTAPEGATLGARKGPPRDHYSTRYTDTSNTKKDTKKARGGNVADAADVGDLASLNGAADVMLMDVISWMHGGDEQSARQWLTRQIACYGHAPVRNAYSKLASDIAGGSIISKPLQTWCRIAQREKDSASTNGAERPKTFSAQRQQENKEFARLVGLDVE